MTLGNKIQTMRKEKGLTQQELADMMGVTDKAVSKWERDISCPDINTMPKLAQVFDVTVDSLLQDSEQAAKKPGDLQGIINTVLKAVALAMGVGVAVLTRMGNIDVNSSLSMLGIGLACLGIVSLGSDK